MMLSLGKKVHVRTSSGEVEGPVPCPVIAVGKGKGEARQEKEYKRRPLTLLGALRWAQVDMPAPKAPGKMGTG